MTVLFSTLCQLTKLEVYSIAYRLFLDFLVDMDTTENNTDRNRHLRARIQIGRMLPAHAHV